MVELPGTVKGVDITTYSNGAYEMITQGEHVYELVRMPSETPSLPSDGIYNVPTLRSTHPPVSPPIVEGEGMPREEERMYANISRDQ